MGGGEDGRAKFMSREYRADLYVNVEWEQKQENIGGDTEKCRRNKVLVIATGCFDLMKKASILIWNDLACLHQRVPLGIVSQFRF